MPEPLLADPYEDPERAAELADSVNPDKLGHMGPVADIRALNRAAMELEAEESGE